MAVNIRNHFVFVVYFDAISSKPVNLHHKMHQLNWMPLTELYMQFDMFQARVCRATKNNFQSNTSNILLHQTTADIGWSETRHSVSARSLVIMNIGGFREYLTKKLKDTHPQNPPSILCMFSGDNFMMMIFFLIFSHGFRCGFYCLCHSMSIIILEFCFFFYGWWVR